MTTAYKQNLRSITRDIKRDVCMKLCPLGVMTLISLIAVFAILLGNPDNAALCKLIFSYSDANLTLLGIDIAALAILYALLQDKQMDENAKQAFKEQNISFVGNAFLQLIAFLLSTCNLLCSNDIMAYITLFIQIWALVLVFDLIIELYTLHTAITHK